MLRLVLIGSGVIKVVVVKVLLFAVKNGKV